LVGSKTNQIIWLKLPYIGLHQPNFSKRVGKCSERDRDRWR